MSSGQKQIRVLAVGNYACANVGDELLLATLRQYVEREGSELTAITLNPAYTEAQHGLAAVSFYDLPAIAAKARDADVLVLGGGGLFTDRFMFTVPQLYDYPAFTLAQFASVCYLAKQFDLRLVLWGQGVGPLVSGDARQIVTDLFGLADHVSVRDPGSERLLRELGVDRSLCVAPDPVWAMAFPEQGFDLRAKFPELAGKKILVVNPLVFERSDELCPKLVSALRAVLDDGWACLWIAFQQSTFDYDNYHFTLPSDRPLIDAMVAEVGPGVVHAIWDAPDILELLPALEQVDAALLVRFHGVMLGLRARTPIMVVEYDDKVTQAAEMAGVPSTQRARVGDSLEQFVSGLLQVMGKLPGSLPWRADVGAVSALSLAAGDHGKVISAAIADARTHERLAWRSARFDWLLAWSAQIDMKRWQAERNSWRTSELLTQAEANVTAGAKKCALLTEELDEVRQQLKQMQHQFDVLGVSTDSVANRMQGHSGLLSRLLEKFKQRMS